MKWIVGLLVGLLAAPVVAQTRKTIEVPPPRYAPQHPAGSAQHPAGAARGGAAPHTPAHGNAQGHEELAQVGAVHQKLRPPELLAEALSTPQDAFRDGQRWPLVDALARTNDRPRQLKITQLYWKLAGAQADYHFARDSSHRLWKATERHADQPAVLSARHSVEAAVDDAEVAVVTAQHELAEQIGLRADESLPLAADQPHVGEYKTYFDSLFSGRTPPPRLRLTNRALPIRRRAIDVHGEAIIAAHDALDATVEDFERRACDLTTLLATFAEFDHQRRAFVAAVRAYNQDIAEYALTVAAPGANGDRLVAMLIKTPTAHQPVRDGRAHEPDTRYEPAEAAPARDRTFRDEPAAEDRGVAPPAGDYRAPAGDYRPPAGDYRPPTGDYRPPASDGYRAPPRDDYRAAPRSQDYPSSAVEPARPGLMNDDRVLPAALASPAGIGPVENADSDGPEAAQPQTEPAPLDPFSRRREARKPPAHDPAAKSPAHAQPAAAPAHQPVHQPAHQPAAADVERGEYSGLTHLSPALRAQRLAEILHWWERTLPPESGEPTTLDSLLKRTDVASRRAAIEAYWRARQAAARYQIYCEAGDHLVPLSAAAIHTREHPGGSTTVLRLQTARLGLFAALLDSQVDLLRAQWELMMASGANFDQPWLLPTTVPHAGRYRLPPHREALGSATRWADSLPPFQKSLQQRAETIVHADAARAEASQPGATSPAGLCVALDQVYRQMRETDAFLQTQTDYNLAIADFALATLPPAAPVEQLVSRLVIPQKSKQGA